MHDPDVGGAANMEGLLDLMRAAGYSEDVAQRAATRRGLDRMAAAHRAGAKGIRP